MRDAVVTQRRVNRNLRQRKRPFGNTRSQRKDRDLHVPMTPRDYASEIEPDATPGRLFEIEQILRRWAADELSRVAQRIDEDYLSSKISFPTQAAQICRDEGAQHLRNT